MIKELFQLLTHLDWVSPLAAIISDVAHNENSWTFFLPWDEVERSGWSEYQIIQALSMNGIRNWGHLLFGGEYMLKVPIRQARYAEYVMNQHGIPISEKSSCPPAVG